MTKLIAMLALALCAGCAKKEENDALAKRFEVPASGYTVAVEPSGNDKVDALVCQLVSQRPAPYPSGYSLPPEAVVFSGLYRAPEVEAAIQALKELGPPIFPSLVKHMRDDRYSFSAVVQGWLNLSVREAVVEILDDGHYSYSGYLHRKTPAGGSSVYLSFDAYMEERGADVWVQWAKSKSRLDIQDDFIDWCVRKEKERGFVDEAQKQKILQTYEDARGRVQKDYSGTNATVNGSRPALPAANSGPATNGTRH